MTDSETERFDAVIIGTGQAGKPLAGALAEAGWKTAIVERAERVGGTCVIDGCTPTKTMLASARVAHLARRAGDYGVRTGPISVDLEAVRARKREVVDDFSTSSRQGLEDRDGLELIMGEARFVAEREVEVTARDGGTRRLAAEHVFIDAGARPAIPPIDGLADVPFLDSTSIMELAEVPDHLVVLGGGPIGLEFAQMFRRFGADVSIIEREPDILPGEDEDVRAALAAILADEGIGIFAGASATRVDAEADGRVRIHLEGVPDVDSVDGTHLLVAVGRTPNTDALDLEATGLSTDERGYISVDARLETEVERIWALGDINGGPPFTHVAYDDYRIVRQSLLDDGDAAADRRIIPYVIFTDPQLGRVGKTETEARERGHEVRVAKLSMAKVARAIETDETRGFMKAVIDAHTDRILGAAILGLEGGEVMSVLETAMIGDLPWQALRDAMYAHPTLAEALNNLFMTLKD